LDKAERWLDKKLQFRFADPSLFARALTHRSAKGRNNERLEYLGDAILDFATFRHRERQYHHRQGRQRRQGGWRS